MLGDLIWSGFFVRYFLVREGGSGWMEHSLSERGRKRGDSMAASLTPPAELLVQRAGCAWNDRPAYFYPCRATMLRAIRPPMALTPAAYCRSVRSSRNARVKTLITPYPHIDQCRPWITSTDTFEYSLRTLTPSSRPLHSNSSCITTHSHNPT